MLRPKAERDDLCVYVCTLCGYCETYIKDPELVDWDALPNANWLNPDVADAAGPYR